MNDLLPLAQFSANVQLKPDAPYLHQPVDGELKTYTWAEVDQQARCIATALLALEVSTGDRIGILSKNCAEWFIADLAIMMAGLISVPIYHTANRDTISYILEDSDCKAVFVGKLDGMEEAEAALNESIPRIIFPYPSLTGQYSWDKVLSHPPLESIHQANEQDMMSIVYTSGSTGNPKGVVLEHQNLKAAASSAVSLLDVTSEQRLMSYLPLAHITERALIETLSFYAACQIFFVESLESFITDVKRCDPNSFISVPRLWNKFQSEILTKIPDKKLQIMLKIPFLGKVVAKKIRAGLGLNSTTLFGSGTAPISPSVLRWYERIGVPISEGWGMTETTGLSCSNQPFNSQSIGTIGRPLDCVEMKIGENSEIMIRGEAVFKEYYKNPVATAKSFTDGWFHTGDMGEVTADGDFKIIGRVKEQFKSAKGKYVAPAPIENYLGRNNDIEQVCVMGEGRKQPIALVVLGQQSVRGSTEINNSLSKTLHIVNKKLEKHQKIDHIIVLKEEWTVENNLLTPTLKIKRSDIEAKFKHFLEMDIATPIYWEE
ncbi:MAG: AMP-binding protein [Kangiellaceae bacterium]